MAEWADVVAIGSRFPGIVEGTSYGRLALKVRDKFLCAMRTNPDALVIRVIDVADKDALLLGDPDVFFTTPHYADYPAVLVRLDAISDEQLAELIEDAWRIQAAKRVVAKFDAGE
jgi:hypothetical protein